MKKVLVFDQDGNYLEDKIVGDDYAPTETEYMVDIDVSICFRMPKLVNGEVVEGAPFNLEAYKKQKISELYNAYQTEKNGTLMSSLIAPDGRPYVFEYAEKNQTDYQKIANKFAILPELNESIIGSLSHGKFIISRADFQIFVQDCDRHETGLYIKFSEKKAAVEAATTKEEVDAVVW